MREILEIIVAVLAVFGGYTLADRLRARLFYPRGVRALVRAAVMFVDTESLALAAKYAHHLRVEQKISDKRLIILTKDDIMNVENAALDYGDVFQYIKCKELESDDKRGDTRE